MGKQIDADRRRHPSSGAEPSRRLRLVPTSLALVAPFVAKAMTEHRGQSLLIELTGHDTGHVSSFDPFPVVERLHGFVAPTNIDGLAIIDDGIASLVWRNGTSFRADGNDHDPWAAPVTSLYRNTEPIVDALLRSLGVATAAPEFGPAWYWLMVWLDDLASSTKDNHHDTADGIGIIDAARWHPGIDPEEIADTDDPTEITEFCLDRLLEHARLTGWSGVRAQAVNGWLDLGRCSASLAQWFDDGSFARLLERQLGSPQAALERCIVAKTRLATETIEMFLVMITGSQSVRAMDCHR